MMNRREFNTAIASAAFSVPPLLGAIRPAGAAPAGLAALKQFMVNAYNQTGSLQLVYDLPNGVAKNGKHTPINTQLQNTVWMDDNALYSALAMYGFNPTIGVNIWNARINQFVNIPAYSNMCRNTSSSCVIGIKAAYDGGPLYGGMPYCAVPGDCGFTPGTYTKPAVVSYPDPASPGFLTLSHPIIGIGYPGNADGSVNPATWTQFGSAKDWFKAGCLRQATLGNMTLAGQMLDQGLAYWDGTGFVNNKPGTYFVRDLAFALICCEFLGRTGPYLDSAQRVPRSSVDAIIWSQQAPDGGIWTNYTYNQVTQQDAKETCEVAPLVLIAYYGQ